MVPSRKFPSWGLRAKSSRAVGRHCASRRFLLITSMRCGRHRPGGVGPNIRKDERTPSNARQRPRSVMNNIAVELSAVTKSNRHTSAAIHDKRESDDIVR